MLINKLKNIKKWKSRENIKKAKERIKTFSWY